MGIDSYLNDVFKQNTLFVRNGPETSRQSLGLTDRSLNQSTIEKYSTDYFCGSQVAIFMGDIWLADISMIQYEMTQNKRPYYGYKSQKWDLVAKGTQIIQGAFALNYTHTNFLNMALAEYQRHSQTYAKDGGPNGLDKAVVDQFIQDVYNKKVELQTLEKQDPYGLPTQDDALARLDFDAKASLLEQYFWGVGDTPQDSENAVIPPDNLPGFDILLSFGNYAKERTVEDEGISSHTAKILNEVTILSHGIQVAVTGEPIQEVYSFIARGMDTPLTRVPSRFILNPDKVGQ